MSNFSKRKNSLRLQGYDYSQSGAYFVTILAYKRHHLFGNIINDTMSYSQIGKTALYCWQEIPKHFPSVELDAFVIMPNHIHGILILHDTAHKVTLGHIVGTFKGAVTRTVKRNYPDTNQPLWHRSFHDHIIRSDKSYVYISNYVQTNPARWAEDSLNI